MGQGAGGNLPTARMSSCARDRIRLTRVIGVLFVMQVCYSIRRATDLYFPESSGVQIIAEPGQFFVTSGYSLVVQVLGKRSRKVVVDGVVQLHQHVFVNESTDNCIMRYLYEFMDVKTWPLQEPLDRPHDAPTTVWGGTCNALDCIEPERPFFDVVVGEWLLMDNIGAYSLSRASGFNGLPFPAVHYIVPQDDVTIVQNILNSSPLRSGFSQPEGVLKSAVLAQWRGQPAIRNRRVGVNDLRC
ncbi:ornithine decarboxylase-like [Dermacentor andersoni]|uniref:ornithine decarboxylase-like n=1 Tax=Dermacentor andersoni TaxID=34620 RepID=UPI003B3AB60E